jgi:hypothetical protein
MHYNRILDLSQLQPVLLDNVNMGTLDEESMDYFFHLVGDVASLVCNDQLYQVRLG